MSFLLPNQQQCVIALNKTWNTNPNWWLGLLFSLSTKFPHQPTPDRWALVPSCWLPKANTGTHVKYWPVLKIQLIDRLCLTLTPRLRHRWCLRAQAKAFMPVSFKHFTISWFTEIPHTTPYYDWQTPYNPNASCIQEFMYDNRLVFYITHTQPHKHFTALWTLSGTTRVSRYQKVHFAIFWIFWSKMKITQAVAPTIRMDCHPIQTNWRPTSAIRTIFTQDALPYTTLPIYPVLGQAPNMLACIPGGLVN